MEVKINFEVSLSEATLSGLKDIILAATMPSLVSKIDLREVISQAAQEEKKEQAEPQPAKKAEAPKPSKKEAENPTPAEEVSELQLFEAVKAAQKVRGVAPKTVREVFKEFGIASSSECPAERRKELLDRINAL